MIVTLIEASNLLLDWVPCHRRPDRTFHYKGVPFPMCARCTGILLGMYIGFFTGFFFSTLSTLIVLLLILPTILDGITQKQGWRTSTNPLRFSTGTMAGFGLTLPVKSVVFFICSTYFF